MAKPLIRSLLDRLPDGLLPFACIGSIGFVVDAAALTVLISIYEWGPYGARAISFSVAVTATWLLNRKWTFSPRIGRGRGREYAGYLAVQVTGALINFGIYVAAIAISEPLARYPVIPLALGNVVSMVFNFLCLRLLVFGGSRRASEGGSPRGWTTSRKGIPFERARR